MYFYICLHSLEGLMLKLKLQYFGYLIRRTDSSERPWCWERLKAGGEGDDRGWDGWMASPTWWTWVWVSSGSWWWTGKPGVLQPMGSQRVRHDWVTKLNWSHLPSFPWLALLTHGKRPWCWERLKVGGEGDDMVGWLDGIMIWWTWVWASSGSWWWTGKPGVLLSMGSPRVRHNWATELTGSKYLLLY